MFAIFVGRGGDESSGADTAFSFDGVKADEVDVFEDGEVMGGVACTGTHRVIGEDDIHEPMPAILDGPVSADSGL